VSDVLVRHRISVPSCCCHTDAEKIKGNESFRLGENDAAMLCYSRSLALDGTMAAVWANRAMAYIRLELFDLAEMDCSVAIGIDSCYVKAHSRRGLVRFKRGKYSEVSDARPASWCLRSRDFCRRWQTFGRHCVSIRPTLS